MSFFLKLAKIFTGGEWTVAFRKKSETDFSVVHRPADEWYADPFVYAHGNEQYIFVEQYPKSKAKGAIGYFQFENGIPINKGIIIENTFHMSYPNVFKIGENFFLIPESSANETITLYRANHFPDDWVKDKDLLTGSRYVDSTVYCDKDAVYLFAYTKRKNYELHVFTLDMKTKTMRLLSKKEYSQNIARPAGRLLVEDGILLRPAQDCSQKYGKSLILFQIDNIDNDGKYEEHVYRRITIDDINLKERFDRVHHITRTDDYEVIDVFKEKFDLLHGIRILLRSRIR